MKLPIVAFVLMLACLAFAPAFGCANTAEEGQADAVVEAAVEGAAEAVAEAAAQAAVAVIEAQAAEVVAALEEAAAAEIAADADDADAAAEGTGAAGDLADPGGGEGAPPG